MKSISTISIGFRRIKIRALLVAVSLLMLISNSGMGLSSSTAEAPSDVVVRVIIDRVKGLDNCWDIGCGSPDFFPDVTIDGVPFGGEGLRIKDQLDIYPNWEFSRPVDSASDSIALNIAIRDQDVKWHDEADLKPTSGRSLNLTVNPFSGLVAGDISGIIYGTVLTSKGTEEKKVQIWFRIEVDRGREERIDFDMTLEAANKLISTAYYSDKFPTYFSGSHTAAGAFQIDVTMHQPTKENIDIFRGSLYVDLLWRVSGKFTVDKEPTLSFDFDRVVPIRLGLKQEGGLRFAAGQIQILDQNLPLPLQGIIRKQIDQKLIQLEDFLVTTGNIINALPTTTLKLESGRIEYDFWIDRPVLESKPVAGSLFELGLRTRLHAILEAEFLIEGTIQKYGKLSQRYDLELSPSASIDYAITDDEVDAVVGEINNFISKLPQWLRDKVEEEIENRDIPIYDGRLIDIVNEQLPEEIDIEVLQPISAEVRLLEDRIRFILQVNSRGNPPEFKLWVKRSTAKIDIRIDSNVKVHIREIGIYEAPTGRLVKTLDVGVIEKGGSYITSWDRTDNNGQFTRYNTYWYPHAMFDTTYNFYLQTWIFWGAGNDVDWVPITDTTVR